MATDATLEAQAPLVYDTLVPDPQVQKEFGVTAMSIWRWDRDPELIELGWPLPIRIRSRKFRSRIALENFKRVMARKAIEQRGRPWARNQIICDAPATGPRAVRDETLAGVQRQEQDAFPTRRVGIFRLIPLLSRYGGGEPDSMTRMEVAMLERPRVYNRHAYHPIADMFPLLKDAEFDDLVEDIRKHGLREPISLFERKIIDGRNRERACIKAGVEPRYRSIVFDNHDAAAAYVISKSIRRRHLTPEQKRELIEKVLRADPTKSDRQIARAVKVDNKTVGAVRKRAEAREEIPHVSKRTDTKGRSQVAHKRNSAKRPPKRTKSTIDLNDQCTAAVRENDRTNHRGSSPDWNDRL
jgi:ParB-like chromosome segregation protein Spo0J